MNKKIKGIVCEHGINDMPKNWWKENKLKMAYGFIWKYYEEENVL